MKSLSDTPLTDAAYDATLEPEYEDEWAEAEAWDFARQLERELNELKALISA